MTRNRFKFFKKEKQYDVEQALGDHDDFPIQPQKPQREIKSVIHDCTNLLFLPDDVLIYIINQLPQKNFRSHAALMSTCKMLKNNVHRSEHGKKAELANQFNQDLSFLMNAVYRNAVRMNQMSSTKSKNVSFIELKKRIQDERKEENIKILLYSGKIICTAIAALILLFGLTIALHLSNQDVISPTLHGNMFIAALLLILARTFQLICPPMLDSFRNTTEIQKLEKLETIRREIHHDYRLQFILSEEESIPSSRPKIK